MIPKRVFYVWGADEEKRRDVNQCMLSWYKTLPDYEIIEINEKSKKYFDFQKELNTNPWFKEVHKRRLFAYVADYIRVKVLYEHGGIYLDTDVSVIKSFDDLLNNEAFVGIEGNNKSIGHEWVEPAILGATKGNVFLKHIVDFYTNEVWESSLFVLPDIFGKFLNECYNIRSFPNKEEQVIIRTKHITIYPEKFFIPFRLNQTYNFECIEPETYTVHWWNGSWNHTERLLFLENKHRLPLSEIDALIEDYHRKNSYQNQVLTVARNLRQEKELASAEQILLSTFSILPSTKILSEYLPLVKDRFKIKSKKIRKLYIFGRLLMRPTLLLATISYKLRNR